MAKTSLTKNTNRSRTKNSSTRNNVSSDLQSNGFKNNNAGVFAFGWASTSVTIPKQKKLINLKF